MGGEAIANARRHQRLGRRRAPGAVRHRHVRRPRHPHQQRRHPARPHAHEHERGGVGRGHQGPPQGHLRPRPATPPPTGATAPRPARRTTAASSTPRRPRASTATSARRTTAPPRPASPRSRSSPPRSWAGTGSPSTAIAPAALTRHDRGPRHGPGPGGDQGADVARPHRPGRRAGWPARRPPTSPGACSTSAAGCCRSARAGTAARPSRTPPTTSELGPQITEIVAKARPNANMNGFDES